MLIITKDGNWSEWIDFFLTAVIEQAKINIQKAQKLLNLYNEMKDRFIQITKSQYAIPALDAFFKQPIISTTKFIQMTGMPNRMTANNILKSLIEAGLINLHKPSEGRKAAEYAFNSIIDIIESRDVY
ncbi:hypothetical protein [Thermodesulfobium sp.]